MNLNDVYNTPVDRKYKRRKGIGLGSSKGKTAGKGSKGQQSRSGYSRKLGHEGGQMPLFRRLPKRGFTNARFQVETTILNLSGLSAFEAGSVVDLEALKAKGLVPRKAQRLKVLGEGEIDRALTVRAHRFSARAKEAIQSAGGTAEEIA